MRDSFEPVKYCVFHTDIFIISIKITFYFKSVLNGFELERQRIRIIEDKAFALMIR